MPTAIRCRELRKTYAAKPPVEALRGLDLEVRAGECFGLLGPNGAGKTTTVEILEGLLQPSSGEVEVLGMRWDRDERKLREKIGVSLQETKFTDKLTVEETLRLFGSFYERGRPAREVMDEVGLGEKSSSWVVNLSGGQRQRLAVACALVGDPDLLFLDEPTTGLDPQSRRQLWDIIRELRSRGRTILLTTHYMDEAERLCDHVAIVDQGKVIALGSPAELIRSLGGDHVVEFALESVRTDSIDSGPTHDRAGGDRAGSDRAGSDRAGSDRAGSAHVPANATMANAESMGIAKADSGTMARTDATAIDLTPLLNLSSVRAARAEGDGIQLTVAEPHVAIPALLAHFERNARALSRLTTRHASLEDVFVSLTGRHLRDE